MWEEINGFEIIVNGTFRYQGRLCVPDIGTLRERILVKGHELHYSTHSSSTKMYHDTKEIYCWNNMQ